MNHINKLLEKNQITRHISDARPNQNTVVFMLLKLCGYHRLRCLAKVNKAMLCVIAKSPEGIFGYGDSRRHLLGS
jgi:hypothetical protein